jgi:hypothetical protein
MYIHTIYKKIRKYACNICVYILVYFSICLPNHPSVRPSIHSSVRSYVYLSLCLTICLFLFPFLSACTSECLHQSAIYLCTNLNYATCSIFNSWSETKRATEESGFAPLHKISSLYCFISGCKFYGINYKTFFSCKWEHASLLYQVVRYHAELQ